ncbi:hypothetical protein VKT23_019581 [Stygiomarasmius scandens]|uniref:DUF6593 domain-containing protein n=1 Tax=Marasmiellus scandens TaxID=2682957 RepID=A0ABR1IQA0_9AGAR
MAPSSSHSPYQDANAPSPYASGPPGSSPYPYSQRSNPHPPLNYGTSPSPNQNPFHHPHPHFQSNSSLHAQAPLYSPSTQFTPPRSDSPSQASSVASQQNHLQNSISFLITDPTLISSFLVTQQGLALYKTETEAGFWGDKKTVVYKLDNTGTNAVGRGSGDSIYPGGFPYIKMAEIEKHSLSDNVVRVWGREVKPVKLTTLNESVEFPGFDGYPYKWKYQKDGFKLQRRDTSDHIELGSFSMKGSRITLEIEKDAMHLLDQCVATLVLGARNRKETGEAVQAAVSAATG